MDKEVKFLKFMKIIEFFGCMFNYFKQGVLGFIELYCFMVGLDFNSFKYELCIKGLIGKMFFLLGFCRL